MNSEVETRLIQKLGKVVEESMEVSGGFSPDKWTRRIKDEFCELSHSLNYDVTASRCKKADDGEWLFDMTWGEVVDGNIVELPFAMECEWSRSKPDLDYDFNKLLVCKAKLKMFIFQQRDEQEVFDIIGWLSNKISSFKMSHSDEKYMFAGFSVVDNKFLFDLRSNEGKAI